MKYNVNWIEKNMGISRKTLRYYEDKKLINPQRNAVNNYREYSEEDIKIIWTIKTLVGMKFKMRQIEDWINDPEEFDFYKVISDNVTELEKDYEAHKHLLDVARTIKVTGRIPTVNDVGTVKFEDFMSYVFNNWNFVDEKLYKVIRATNDMNESIEEFEKNSDLNSIIDYFRNIDFNNMKNLVIGTYYKILSGLYMYPEDNEIVLRIVDQLFNHVNQYYDGISIELFVEAFSLEIFEGDINEMNKRVYGEKGIKYITKALEAYKKYVLNQ